MFNIGQADSLLVIGPAPGRRTLLIDLGEPTAGSRLPSGMVSSADHVLERLERLTGDTSVDYFLATHYHRDHLGYGANRAAGWGSGVVRLLSDFSLPFSVGQFIHIQDDGAEYMEPAAGRGVYTTIARRMPLWEQNGRVGSSTQPTFGTAQIDLGPGVSVDILAFAGKVPSGDSAFDRAVAAGVDYAATPGNENDLSIALQITAGEFELFTGGDLNGTDDPVAHPLYVSRDFGEVYTNVEHHLVSYWESEGIESDVEIYRANHHGSEYSSTERLLDALDPEFILYSTGGDHRHPSNGVVARGARTARQLATTWVTDLTTFRNGRGARVGEIAILVAPDGKSYTINGERHLAFSTPEEAAGDDEGEEDRQH
jgi:beta-lactamase superfamily II metal-dependent hydrolase